LQKHHPCLLIYFILAKVSPPLLIYSILSKAAIDHRHV
jgi:hypothetical protein